MDQGIIWYPKHDPIKLKGKGDVCPHCGRKIRWYCKTMDNRLVKYLLQIIDQIGPNNRYRKFDVRNVFGDSFRIRADFIKLRYWDLVKHDKRVATYYISEKGWDFINGKIMIPKRIWVFNNKMVAADDEMVSIADIEPRWQFLKSHYTMDYIVPQKEIIHAIGLPSL